VSGIDLSPSAYAFTSTRIAGKDRYGTSVASTQLFEPGVSVLYVASGEKWADALSAAPAAASQDGALLLTDPNTLPAAVAAEITRLAPKKTIVVGSELTVADAVYKQIDALVGDVARIGGTDRYDTSRKIVEDAYTFSPFEFYSVVLATGNDFPDALSIAPLAGRYSPVLLVDGAKNHLDTETRATIARFEPYQATVLGRTPSISAGIEEELVSSGLVPAVNRVGGADRYETSRLINENRGARPLQDTTYVASGEGFADALSGATAAAAEGAPISLSRPSCVPAATVDSLKRLHFDTAKVLGSELTLSRGVGTVTSC
jgi:putative cell wall-binding protein